MPCACFHHSRAPLRTALLLAVAVFLLSANLFGKDKLELPQWAIDASKIPTPAYAKDSEAVILFDEYVESIDDHGRAVEREREALRVLKPQGRHSTCAISYDVDEKVNYFHVWTLTADGKKFQAQETDFTEEGDTGVPVMLSTYKTRVAHPLAVDVGATVVCESEERMRPYQQEKIWHIQTGIPFISEALEIDLPGERKFAEGWHNFKPVPPTQIAPNHWRWELKDVPALTLRDVPSSPDWSSLAGRMSVQWGDAAVEGKDNQWRAIGQWFTTLEAGRPDPSPEITAQVQSLIAGASDFYSKLSRIAEFIQKNVRYFTVSRGISGFQANHAADIFHNRYGDCKDKATLLISMLQVAGIHAFYVAVDDKRGLVDPEDPSTAGDHMIAAIEVPSDLSDPRLMALAKAKDGKRYLLFDPTNQNTPIGTLPSYEQGSFGLIAAGSASQILALPVLAPEASGTDQKGTFTLSPDGTISGSVNTAHSGPDGDIFRRFLQKTDDKERRGIWESYVADSLPGVSLDDFHFTQPATLDRPIGFDFKVTERQYAHSSGPLLLVRPRVVGSLARPFDNTPRTVPIDLDATGRWHDSFDITLPPGYTIDELPDPAKIDLGFASYSSAVSVKGSVLHYERDYVVRQVELPADKAADFRKLESVILADERSSAVLKKQ